LHWLVFDDLVLAVYFDVAQICVWVVVVFEKAYHHVDGVG